MCIRDSLDHPLEYIRHVAAHVYGMWSITFQQHVVNRHNWTQSTIGVYESSADVRRMAKWTPYPSIETAELWDKAVSKRTLSDIITYQVFTALGYLLLPIAIGSAMVAVWAFALLVLRKPISLPVAAAAFLSLLLWAYIGVVAAAQPALQRYAIVNFVLILPLAWIGAYGLVKALKKMTPELAKRLQRRKSDALPHTADPVDNKTIEQERGTPIA